MLDQLVESRNNSAENARRSEFLLGTMIIVVSVLLGGWVYSLFHKEYGMGSGDLDISSLVAPVALPEDAPPPPPPEPEKQEKQLAEKPTVIEKVATMEESLDKPPKLDDSRKLLSPPLAKKDANFVDEGKTNGRQVTEEDRSGQTQSGLGGTGDTSKTSDEPELKVKTPTPTPPAKTPPPAPKTISGGVVNGKATNLVKPPYPAAARAVRASGAVNVQVTIDESGNVISASAVSGHPLLRAAAVQAARSSKFSPTMLSGQAVKVTGVIVYNFVP